MGVLDRARDLLRDDCRALSGRGVAASEDRHQFLTLYQADVRYGSLADMVSRPRHVRFAPRGGHSSARVARPLCANCGYSIDQQGLMIFA